MNTVADLVMKEMNGGGSQDDPLTSSLMSNLSTGMKRKVGEEACTDIINRIFDEVQRDNQKFEEHQHQKMLSRHGSAQQIDFSQSGSMPVVPPNALHQQKGSNYHSSTSIPGQPNQQTIPSALRDESPSPVQPQYQSQQQMMH